MVTWVRDKRLKRWSRNYGRWLTPSPEKVEDASEWYHQIGDWLRPTTNIILGILILGRLDGVVTFRRKLDGETKASSEK